MGSFGVSLGFRASRGNLFSSLYKHQGLVGLLGKIHVSLSRTHPKPIAQKIFPSSTLNSTIRRDCRSLRPFRSPKLQTLTDLSKGKHYVYRLLVPEPTYIHICISCTGSADCGPGMRTRSVCAASAREAGDIRLEPFSAYRCFIIDVIYKVSVGP